MNPVLSWILDQPEDRQALFLELRDLLLSYPDVREKLTHGVPFFHYQGNIAYLSPRKDGSVDLSFTRGAELAQQTPLIDLRDRTTVASFNFFPGQKLPVQDIRIVIGMALALNARKTEARKARAKTSRKSSASGRPLPPPGVWD